MFSERDFDFSKYLIIHCETKDYEKSKSRSENVVFYNKNETIFNEIHQKIISFLLQNTTFSECVFQHPASLVLQWINRYFEK